MALDLKASLTRKIGPLPVWAWGAVVAGAVVAYKVLAGGGGGNASPALQTIAGGTLPDAFDPDAAGGSGGQGSSADPPDDDPVTPPVGGGILTCDPRFMPRIADQIGWHRICQNGQWTSVPIPGFTMPPTPRPLPIVGVRPPGRIVPSPVSNSGRTIITPTIGSGRLIIPGPPVKLTPPSPTRAPGAVAIARERVFAIVAPVLPKVGAPGAFRPSPIAATGAPGAHRPAPTTKAPTAAVKATVKRAVAVVGGKKRATAPAKPPVQKTPTPLSSVIRRAS